MTTKDVGGNASDATDSDADPITNKTGLVTLSSGEVNRTVDAGVYLKAHLGDFVFDDKNGNGLQDTGEPGIAGVTVNLIDAAGLTPIAATTTTGANGSYGFDVAPGNHQTDAGEMVTLTQAGVASLVVDHTNTLSVDAQGNGLGETSSATLASGASVTMTDVYFKVSTEDAKAAGVQLPTVAEVLGDDRALDAVLGQGVAAPVQVQPTDVPLDGLGEATELIRRINALTHDHVPFAAV